MKKLLLTLMAALMAVTAANASIFDKYTLKRSDLPEEAQTMLTEYFPKAKVSMIKVDKHLLKRQITMCGCRTESRLNSVTRGNGPP